MLRSIQAWLFNIYYYVLGHTFARLYYKKRYLTGKHFSSKYGGIGAIGWRWTVQCMKGCRKLGNIGQAPWPVDPRTRIVHYSNISFNVDDINIFQSPGCYFQAHAKISIGKGCWIAPNVGLITANHDFMDLNKHSTALPISIGENCWIGMNAMILPGVVLGKHTIVGAGSVVTKSFPDGNCVIAGNPARKIREL